MMDQWLSMLEQTLGRLDPAGRDAVAKLLLQMSHDLNNTLGSLSLDLFTLARCQQLLAADPTDAHARQMAQEVLNNLREAERQIREMTRHMAGPFEQDT